uniref:Uncharacterized protein n=1 Tax=Sparus aurata TaxID=8175 RepID=A0A671U672_SPAAU
MSGDADKAARAVGRELCFREAPRGNFDAGGYEGTEESDEHVKGGAYAVKGSGYYRDENGPVCVEAKGPNAGIGVGLSGSGARVMTKAELVSASVSAGPATATVGLSADTGASIGPAQLEAKVLGTGVSIGREMGVSFLGTGFKFKLW